MLTRRQWLTRAGAGAAASSILGRAAITRAAAGPPLRLILFPSMNGSESQHFWPSPGNLAAMSVVTAPLAEYQKQITFVRGINMSGSENHYAVRSMFTGFPIGSYDSPDPNVKSVDQVVADHFMGSAPTSLRSLHLGVIPADSISFYQRAGRSTFFFAPKPVDYEANPVTAFDRTFPGAGGTPGPGPLPTPVATFDNDVLDMIEADFGEMDARLRDSPRERFKLQQHREAMRGLRPTATTPPPGGGMPLPPPVMSGKCDATPLPSVEKLRATLQGKAALAYKHEYFSDIFDAQIDILARALVCGLTRVGTIQAGSADGNAIVPVGPGYPHHNTSHGNQSNFSQCQKWYAGKFHRLLKALDVPDPLDPTGKTVLYNSAIVWLAECLPVSHSSQGVPAMIAGNAGGALKAGTYVDTKGATNKALIQTIAQLMGAPTAPQFGGGTISELRA